MQVHLNPIMLLSVKIDWNPSALLKIPEFEIATWVTKDINANPADNAKAATNTIEDFFNLLYPQVRNLIVNE